MGNKLYVGNLPYDTNEDDLTALFAQAGTVSTVNVMRDRETGRARGFGGSAREPRHASSRSVFRAG